jgi:hypothetical protein
MAGAAGLRLAGAVPTPARSAPGPQVATPHPGEVIVTSTAVRENFCGVGFHAPMSLEVSTQDFFEQVLAKRWRELNPGFARVFHPWQEGHPGVRDPKVLDALARQLVFLKEATGTEIYVTTSDLKPVASEEERRAYASAVVDDLEYLVNRGASNLKYYCCTNELSLQQWADLRDDLPRYESYQRSIFDELKRRSLAIKLLATDASDLENWPTLEWAAQHMDDVTGVYGAHHYINEHDPTDLDFYASFKERCQWAVNLARGKKKDFILGEFGNAQYFELKYGIRWDCAKYFDTPLEPLAGLQLAEAVLAAINAGVYAMGYWTFNDYPDEKGGNYVNHWGVFKWLTNGAQTRPAYYSLGLLTKFFRGPGTVFETKAVDERLRVAALRRKEDKTWSIAVLNRNSQEVPIRLTIAGASQPAVFRKYVYDPKRVPVTVDGDLEEISKANLEREGIQRVPVTVDGDLQEPSAKVPLREATLTDTVEATSLAVYTTHYDDTPPAPVRGLEVTRIHDTRIPGEIAEATRLRWTPNSEPDLCYYRVFHHGVRIGSTAATEFIDAGPDNSRPRGYAVVAVDRSGNASSL